MRSQKELELMLSAAHTDCHAGNGTESLLRLYSALDELCIVNSKEQAFRAAQEEHATQVQRYAEATKPTRDKWGLGASLPGGDVN